MHIPEWCEAPASHSINIEYVLHDTHESITYLPLALLSSADDKKGRGTSLETCASEHVEKIHEFSLPTTLQIARIVNKSLNYGQCGLEQQCPDCVSE